MRQYLELETVPVDESCQQVGTPSYDHEAALAEAYRYKALLKRKFPVPDGAYGYFVTKSFAHDFGSYRQVCAVYDDADESSVDWAFNVENNLPATWDDDAIIHAQVKEGTA